MIRTQIQLTEAQARKVRRLAASRHVSMAEVIRESVDDYVRNQTDDNLKEKRARALKLVGGFSSGKRDLAEKHDKYLEEAYQ